MVERSESQPSTDTGAREEDLLRQAEQKGEAEAAVRLGDLLSRRGDAREALAAYERGERRGDPDASVRRAGLLQQLGQSSQAESAFRIAVDRGDGGAALGLATLLDHSDQVEEAGRYYELAVERGDPGASVAMSDFIQRTDPAAGRSEETAPAGDRELSDVVDSTAEAGGHPDAKSLSPSVEALVSPRSRVTAYELVDRLISSHEGYGRGKAEGFHLGPPEEGARVASLREWAPEIGALSNPG